MSGGLRQLLPTPPALHRPRAPLQEFSLNTKSHSLNKMALGQIGASKRNFI